MSTNGRGFYSIVGWNWVAVGCPEYFRCANYSVTNLSLNALLKSGACGQQGQ